MCCVWTVIGYLWCEWTKTVRLLEAPHEVSQDCQCLSTGVAVVKIELTSPITMTAAHQDNSSRTVALNAGSIFMLGKGYGTQTVCTFTGNTHTAHIRVEMNSLQTRTSGNYEGDR